jgi:2-oxoisovalerate dehydrogenase E2 component (dihydrolipoyl transacylase)
VTKLHHEVGGIVKVGSALADIRKEDSVLPKLANEESVKLSIPSAPSESKVNEILSNRKGNNISLATPAVRKIAKEKNIDLSQITPSGPKGRILKEDVLGHLRSNTTRIPGNTRQVDLDHKPSQFPSKKVALDDSEIARIENKFKSSALTSNSKVPIKGVQKQMLKSMTAAREVIYISLFDRMHFVLILILFKIQHLTLNEEISVDKLIRLRKDLKSVAEKHGIKLSYLPFFIKVRKKYFLLCDIIKIHICYEKATSLALKKYPILNGSISADGNDMIYHNDHNIGIAMDSPKGLMVPVIKQVNISIISSCILVLFSLNYEGSNEEYIRYCLGTQSITGFKSWHNALHFFLVNFLSK